MKKFSEIEKLFTVEELPYARAYYYKVYIIEVKDIPFDMFVPAVKLKTKKGGKLPAIPAYTAVDNRQEELLDLIFGK